MGFLEKLALVFVGKWALREQVKANEDLILTNLKKEHDLLKQQHELDCQVLWDLADDLEQADAEAERFKSLPPEPPTPEEEKFLKDIMDRQDLSVEEKWKLLSVNYKEMGEFPKWGNDEEMVRKIMNQPDPD